VIVVALDTATASTVAGVLLDDGRVVERRDDPPPGTRPNHASRLLALAEAALAEAGIDWTAVDRIAVGIGPGGFTGLRIGVATARALAQAHDTLLVPVSTLQALALDQVHPAVAAIDARRGEVFAAAWLPDGTRVLGPRAWAPEELAHAVASLEMGAPDGVAVSWPRVCLGDGAVRFRSELERAGADVPPDGSSAHRVGAEALCRLGAAGEPASRDGVLPDYRREPDAKPSSPP
jgi:tRNA threonylcarbamoyladenosine biosynthesis protein TsaB